MSAILNPSRFAGFALLILAIGGACGCQLMSDTPEWPGNPFRSEPEAVVPTRMMVMWTDTVLHQPQQSGVRGFGARIYFYSEDDPDPVKVDGALAVYAFDASEINPTSPKPKRKFVFTPDQFAEYMSETSMGTSYSVWCPWDEVGGYNEQLSLIVRFEGRNGGVVISDATIKLLPGLSKPIEATQQGRSSVAQAYAVGDPESANQLAGYEKQDAKLPAKAARRETETIDLPPSFYRHLKGPAQPLTPAPPKDIPETPSATAEPTGPPAAEPSVEPEAVSDATETADPAASGRRGAPEENGAPTPPATSGKRKTSPPSDESGLQTSARRPTYPRRTLGDGGADVSSREAQHPMSRGWISQLQPTPRYGFPRQPAKGDSARSSR